jgi:hypothetical protein
MTDAPKIVTTSVAALIRGLVGLFAFGLALRVPPPPLAHTAPGMEQILQGVRFDDLGAVDQALPEDVGLPLLLRSLSLVHRISTPGYWRVSCVRYP